MNFVRPLHFNASLNREIDFSSSNFYDQFNGTSVYRNFERDPYPLSGKTVLITGGAGSFGSSLVRRLLNDPDGPSKIIIYSRDEMKHHLLRVILEEEYSFEQFKKIRFFQGCVRDLSRLQSVFKDVDVVIHAAATKIVPSAEYNPTECIATNIGGAQNVIRAAIDCHVERIVALSTDKACAPINLYGSTKLASDKLFVAANNIVGKAKTRFCVVRYGNVVGSNGSVLPFFKNKVARGVKALPLTDPRMTRFWITLDQGVALTLSALSLTRGGEIFVPKIPSMRVVDFITALWPDYPIDIIGIRQGEKLHELMITEDDAHATVDLGDCYVIEPKSIYTSRESFINSGSATLVKDRFSYSSDLNSEWLDHEALRSLCSQ